MAVENEDTTSMDSDQIRKRLALALQKLENTKKPACPFLSISAKQSLKQFNVTLPGSRKELDRFNRQYVSELLLLYGRKQ